MATHWTYECDECGTTVKVDGTDLPKNWMELTVKTDRLRPRVHICGQSCAITYLIKKKAIPAQWNRVSPAGKVFGP